MKRSAFVATVAVAAVVGGGFGAWQATRSDGSSPTSSPDAAATPGVEHVHGLGVDPADDALYVATHFGLFRIPEGGSATRVGESFQDTMGFTVAGPERFLGSGHPDVAGMRVGQPGLLGLIESSDAGDTWHSLSLSGEVDFHGLAYVNERVYGWDSSGGRFMVSDDMQTWETRATLELFSFAVDPSDSGRVIGATPTGLVVSADDGASWSPLDVGPVAVVLSWDASSGLWSAGPDGTVHHSTDGGDTWREVGALPGAPGALLATGNVLWAAAHDDDRTGIYRSDDDGRTWALRYRDPSS